MTVLEQTESQPQPASLLRNHIAIALANRAGSKVFKEHGPEWEHMRSVWLAHADTALAALHDWEAQGTTIRLCVIPGCFKQFDIVAVMEGQATAPGWRQCSTVGYACPTHANLLWGNPDTWHIPSWGYTDVDGPDGPSEVHALLSCTCGWNAGRTRFRGHGTVLWQAHALEILETL